MAIKSIRRTVYRCPTSGRCFFTLDAACRREASDLVRKKYPNEMSGACASDGGWTFYDDPKLVLLRDRIARILKRNHGKQDLAK